MERKEAARTGGIMGLLAAILGELRGQHGAAAPRVHAGHGKHCFGFRPAALQRFVRLCPRCDRPLRRTEAHGVRTDRYFDKAAGETICTVCAEWDNQQ